MCVLRFFTPHYFHVHTELVVVYSKLYQLKDRNGASFTALVEKSMKGTKGKKKMSKVKI